MPLMECHGPAPLPGRMDTWQTPGQTDIRLDGLRQPHACWRLCQLGMVACEWQVVKARVWVFWGCEGQQEL